jgi:enoyl-[acyl-carrier-protein] reductase (NADH)
MDSSSWSFRILSSRRGSEPGQGVTLAADPIRSKALDSIVEHPDIISEGESWATDDASTQTEESFAPPEEDRAEGEA